MSTGRHDLRVILKTDLPDDDLHVGTWVRGYPGADWHEREAWEMYGFVFDGHPTFATSTCRRNSKVIRCARTTRSSHAR